MQTSSSAPLALSNPLVLEISSLKAAVERYQHAADSANIHLQHQALDISTFSARCTALEQENAILRAEVALLRSTPESSSTSSLSNNNLAVSELTLALRRVSEQLDQAEEALREHTEQLGKSNLVRARLKVELERAEQDVTMIREREEETKKECRRWKAELEKKEEELKMVDLVVREYADLVRTLEGRTSVSSQYPRGARTSSDRNRLAVGHSKQSSLGSSGASSSTSSIPHQHGTVAALQEGRMDSLHEGRIGLQRLMTEFHHKTEQMEEEISRLHVQIEKLETKLVVADGLMERGVKELASVKSELASALRADKSAVKMVERYMSFSQQSSNLLQTAMQTQKKRHAATVLTLEQQLETLTRQVERERALADELRSTLDDLTLEIAREAFGRRREITLRLGLLERERQVAKMLERWIDTLQRRHEQEEGNKESHLSGAREILAALRGVDAPKAMDEDNFVREKLVQEIEGLRAEVQEEMNRRLELQRIISGYIVAESRGEALPLQEDSDQQQSYEERMMVKSHDQPVTGREDSSGQPAAMENATRARTPSAHSASDTASLDLEEYSPTPPSDDNGVPDQTTSLPSHNSSGTTEPATTTATISPSHAKMPLESDVDEHASQTVATIQGLKKCELRYEDIQTALNDCHDALSALQASVIERTNEGKEKGGAIIIFLPAAVERLYDYCEDARVELEILIADEARISQGYETLLNLRSDKEAGSTGQEALLEKIDVFVKGTDPAIVKARSVFEGKLENLMHDIATIKRALHEDMSTPDGAEAQTGIAFPTAQTGDEERPDQPMPITMGSSLWQTIANNIPTPRSSSPAPRVAQTFGTVMSTGRPRLPSNQGKQPGTNPLNHLGLRIAMPQRLSPYASAQSLHTSTLNIHSPFPFSAPLSTGIKSPGFGTGEPTSAPISRASSWFGGAMGVGGGISRAKTMSNILGGGFGGMSMSPASPPAPSSSAMHVGGPRRSGTGHQKAETRAEKGLETATGQRISSVVALNDGVEDEEVE